MTFTLDTNIIIHAVRRTLLFENLKNQLDLFNSNNSLFISVVTIGEIYSFANQNQWGLTKRNEIESLLVKLNAIPILTDRIFHSAYSKIDTFSQGKDSKLPLGRSAINMGKNDLWIAATTLLTRSTLITTDKDFSHLDNVFFSVIYQNPNEI